MMKSISALILLISLVACTNVRPIQTVNTQQETTTATLTLPQTATSSEPVVKNKNAKKQKYYYFRAKRQCLEGSRKHKETLKDCIARLKEQGK